MADFSHAKRRLRIRRAANSKQRTQHTPCSLTPSFSLSLSLSHYTLFALKNQTATRDLSPLIAAEFYVIFCLRLQICCSFFSARFPSYLCCTACGLLVLLAVWEKGVGGGAEWGVALFGYWQSSALRWLFGHLNRFEWHNLPLIWIIAKPIILALPFSCQCNLIYTRIAPLKVMR